MCPLSTCLIPNFSVSLPHRRSTTVSLESDPFNKKAESLKSCPQTIADLLISVFDPDFQGITLAQVEDGQVSIDPIG